MTHFFFNTTRKYILAMLKQFNHLIVQKVINGEVYEHSVPIVWGTKERLAYLTDETYIAGGRHIQIKLPRMALTLMNIEYDGSRHTNKLNKTTISTTDGIYSQYSPVPYNYKFQLNIQTRTIDDFFQIIEQIVPYYNPVKNINVIEIPGYPSSSIKIGLDSVSFEPDIDYDEDGKMRLVNGYLELTLFGHMYMPIKDIKIVQEIQTGYAPQFETESAQFDTYLTKDLNEDGVISDNETKIQNPL